MTMRIYKTTDSFNNIEIIRDDDKVRPWDRVTLFADIDELYVSGLETLNGNTVFKMDFESGISEWINLPAEDVIIGDKFPNHIVIQHSIRDFATPLYVVAIVSGNGYPDDSAIYYTVYPLESQGDWQNNFTVGAKLDIQMFSHRRFLHVNILNTSFRYLVSNSESGIEILSDAIPFDTHHSSILPDLFNDTFSDLRDMAVQRYI